MTSVAPEAKQPFRHAGKLVRPPGFEKLMLERLGDKMWRLDNIYHIVNDDGELVPFKLRPIQRHFLEHMWHRCAVLKSRQHGFTTLIDLWLLDTALFTENFRGVIIAHKEKDAKKILKHKIERPYFNLHPDILERVGIEENNATEISFTNGSSIEVTVSGRSGTAQGLHVSELGHTARHRPDVSREIISGSFDAVHQKGFIFIESTAMGATGDFFELCEMAREMKRDGRKLSPLDFKFFFYAWFDKPDNRLADEYASTQIISDELHAYFDRIEKEVSVTLDLGQRAWYSAKYRVVGRDLMRQENPSTPEEAFEASNEGEIFADQMARAEEDERIVESLPYQKGRPVRLAWDIGVGDPAACWIVQPVGAYHHVLGYYEAKDQGMEVHIQAVEKMAKANGWRLPRIAWGPHDMAQRNKGQAMSLAEECATKYGMGFEVVPKIAQKIMSIQAGRRAIDSARFDASGPGMKAGIERLKRYHWTWNDRMQEYTHPPSHKGSDGPDAWQCYAMGYETLDDDDHAQPDPRYMDGGDPDGFGQREPAGSMMRAFT